MSSLPLATLADMLALPSLNRTNCRVLQLTTCQQLTSLLQPTSTLICWSKKWDPSPVEGVFLASFWTSTCHLISDSSYIHSVTKYIYSSTVLEYNFQHLYFFVLHFVLLYTSTPLHFGGKHCTFFSTLFIC